MKKLIVLLLSIGGISLVLNCQVSLSYTTIKKSEDSYEVRITASIDGDWHIYSMNQPKNAIGIPTQITIRKNPLIKLTGKMLEEGKLEKISDPITESENWQYSREVVFTQSFKITAKVKTSITGSITFQICNSERCLPPRTTNFTIPVQ